MADGPDGARRARPEAGADDVLARLGLTGGQPDGRRAARRRAAEDTERGRDGAAGLPGVNGHARPPLAGGQGAPPPFPNGHRHPPEPSNGHGQPSERAGGRGHLPATANGHTPPPAPANGHRHPAAPAGGRGPSMPSNGRGDLSNGRARPLPTNGVDLMGPRRPGGEDNSAPPRAIPTGTRSQQAVGGAASGGWAATGQGRAPTRERPQPGRPPRAPDGSPPRDRPAPPPGRRGGSPRTGAADPDRPAPPAGPSRTDTRPAPERPSAARPSAESPSGSGDDVTVRTRHIDETLTRLTAAHAGLVLGDDDAPADDGPPTRRGPRALRLGAAAVAVAVLAVSATGWGAQQWLGGAVRSAAALDPGSGAIVDPADQAGAENVLVVATDSATTPGAAARPDSVVVAHIPAAGGPLTVLAIPEDLEVARPPCERYDAAGGAYTADTVPAQARTQLASALDLGGPRCATRAVQQLTGLAITRYVGIDLDQLGATVDAVSGVRVCTPRAVVDAVLGPVAPTPGQVDLDAQHAAQFVRAASVAGDTPSGRVERQQQVVAAVLGTVLSTTGLLDMPRLIALRPALGQALATDGADIDQVLALARSMRDLHAPGVTFATVPTDPDPTGQGSVLRTTDAAAIFDALRTDAALPASTSSPAAGPKPSDLQVEVRNASDRAGLAGKTADTLRGLGFGIGPVSNADQPTPQTLIRYSPDQTAAAELLAATVPSATTVPDPGATGVLQLVLGRSFDGVVKAPTATAATKGPAVTTGTSVSPAAASATCP